MMIRDLWEELLEHIEELSPREKLFIIILVGAVLRSPMFFVNYDASVYQMWLEYFLEFGELPYYDHPPALFMISGGLVILSNALQGLNPHLYWYLLLPVFVAIYLFTKERSPYLFALVSYLAFYTAFIIYAGRLHEVAMLVSFFSGVAFIYLSYLTGSIISEEIGLYSALFTSFAWWPIVYSDVFMTDMLASAAMIASYYTYYILIESENPEVKWYIFSAISLTFALFSKYYALIIAFSIAVYGIYRIHDLVELVKKGLPGAVSLGIFFLWVISTDLYVTDHFAVENFFFLTGPSPASFAIFFFTVLTPLIAILVALGAFKLREDRNMFLYLLFPVFLGLSFHFVQVFFFQRSHSLINLSNYMLYSFPLLAVIASVGWESIEIGHKALVISVLVFTLVIPAFMGSGLEFKYDEDYKTPDKNLNSLSSDNLESLGLEEDDIPTLHHVFNFERRLKIISEYSSRKTHVRWLSPSEIRIVSTEEDIFRTNFAAFRPINITVYRDNKRLRNINIADREEIYFDVGKGETVYTFETDHFVPFISGHIFSCSKNTERCDTEDLVKLRRDSKHIMSGG